MDHSDVDLSFCMEQLENSDQSCHPVELDRVFYGVKTEATHACYLANQNSNE